jgi:hypothetical protein
VRPLDLIRVETTRAEEGLTERRGVCSAGGRREMFRCRPNVSRYRIERGLRHCRLEHPIPADNAETKYVDPYKTPMDQDRWRDRWFHLCVRSIPPLSNSWGHRYPSYDHNAQRFIVPDEVQPMWLAALAKASKRKRLALSPRFSERTLSTVRCGPVKSVKQTRAH